MAKQYQNRATLTTVAGATLLALAIGDAGTVAADGPETAPGGRESAVVVQSTTKPATQKADYSREALRKMFVKPPEPRQSELSESAPDVTQGAIEFYYTDGLSQEPSRFAERMQFVLGMILAPLSLESPMPGFFDFEDATGLPRAFVVGGGLPLTAEAMEEYSIRFTMPDDITPEEERYRRKVLAQVFVAIRRENSPEYRRLANATPNVPSRSESEDSSPPAIASVRRLGEAEVLFATVCKLWCNEAHGAVRRDALIINASDERETLITSAASTDVGKRRVAPPNW